MVGMWCCYVDDIHIWVFDEGLVVGVGFGGGRKIVLGYEVVGDF